MNTSLSVNSPRTAGEALTHSVPDRPSICGEAAVLSTDLALLALRYADLPKADPADIRDVRCTLQAHSGGNHYAFIVETTATTSAWTRWKHGTNPGIVLVLPDCPTTATAPGQGAACSEYESHPGGHTWQVDDPLNPVQPAR